MKANAQMNHRRGRASAFTLVEVTLAVGITSVALVGLLAMVPQGIRTMQKATDIAIEARIHQQITSEISLVAWQDRVSFHNTVRFYDNQGIHIPAPLVREDGSIDTRAYTARILVPVGGSLPARLGSASYRPLDLAGIADDENEMQLVLVEISNAVLVRNAGDFDNEKYWANVRTYRSTLVRTNDLISARGSATP